MEAWDDVLSDRDRRVIELSGYGTRRGLGERPVVLVVDAQQHFVGVRGDVFVSIAAYPTSVGDEAWIAVGRIQSLITRARACGIPVMYSKSGIKAGEELFDSFARKRRPVAQAGEAGGMPSLEIPIVAELAPRPGDVVIEKRFPSAFFGSPLVSFLHAYGADTVLLAGFTTSGCVRATCVDAMSYNFRVGVVADGCADRLHIAHKASLLDIHMKYGDVMTADDALEYMERVGRASAAAP